MKKLIAVFAVSATALIGSIDSAQAQNCDKNIEIVNDTCCTDIYSFQASPTGQDAWGPDQLRNQVIPPGYKKTFWMDDGSNRRYYDFRAVMDNGEVATRYRVDVCSTTRWTIYD